ncbi:6-hydroxynicotinate 3-monooxygenase precursor [Marinomonas spartinae]|uniref:6-hydroxynicotinate 3-monooxygenase n=1 Tax=Marinomonas spartinae TaxID=1792290 RepID=A0A1A8T8Y4_9GAMM|nr:FAD-dependent monooxygenase [Marinomonas spartinae]SBS27818.1 6-hydroxynicotinate 3-monooxygenase precursor [Marinomonas spartinae]SBS28902.1 6-hydroxynicotinate 3-monooxygenase precursor [Marinomonas spartinae]
MNKIKDVAVAGAGIGGLTVALGLAQQGVDVTIFEQASVLAEVGAGLQMSPNAMKVLRQFGLEDTLRPYAFEPQQATIRHFKSGEYYLKAPLGQAAIDRYGAPYWHLHRADLHHVLVEACQKAGVTIQLGATVTGYQKSDQQNSVVLCLQDGSQYETDLVIGADGIRSVIREQMLGKQAPDFMGQVAWRGVVPVSKLNAIHVQPDACVWAGPGRHLVTYYLRGGEWVNFVAVEERGGWQSESWREEGDINELRSAFAGWHPEVTELLLAADSTFLWALNGRSSLRTWFQGRVVLLGDACHPMLPFMAQGAAMAIEDAYVLVASLMSKPLPDALASYEILRKPRAVRIQNMSKDNTGLYHMHGGLFGQMKLNAVKVASQFVPSAIQGKLDPVYGYDVVKAAAAWC